MNKVSIEQASQSLGLSRNTILTWEKKQLIKSDKQVNNTRLFDLEEIHSLQLQIANREIVSQVPILRNNVATNWL